jgi:hypothetical protein
MSPMDPMEMVGMIFHDFLFSLQFLLSKLAKTGCSKIPSKIYYSFTWRMVKNKEFEKNLYIYEFKNEK